MSNECIYQVTTRTKLRVTKNGISQCTISYESWQNGGSYPSEWTPVVWASSKKKICVDTVTEDVAKMIWSAYMAGNVAGRDEAKRDIMEKRQAYLESMGIEE